MSDILQAGKISDIVFIILQSVLTLPGGCRVLDL